MSRLRTEFSRDGIVVIKGFYDLKREVAPIHEGIRRVVELVARKHGLVVPCATADEAMMLGYRQIVAKNRAWGGTIYDAVKQIPAFMSLVANSRNADVFSEMRPESLPGIAAGGYGIRIDLPSEEKYRAPWHQEFPAQLRSMDGIVFWSPLLPVSADMGPVEVALGSHTEGLIPVYEEAGEAGKSGAYALRLDAEAERLARYRHAAPLSEPGDLILMDFLTMHQSGQNISDRPRWSMQFRYFNFADPIGIEIDWKGSFAAGQKFADVMPQLVASRSHAT